MCNFILNTSLLLKKGINFCKKGHMFWKWDFSNTVSLWPRVWKVQRHDLFNIHLTISTMFCNHKTIFQYGKTVAYYTRPACMTVLKESIWRIFWIFRVTYCAERLTIWFCDCNMLLKKCILSVNYSILKICPKAYCTLKCIILLIIYMSAMEPPFGTFLYNRSNTKSESQALWNA